MTREQIVTKYLQLGEKLVFETDPSKKFELEMERQNLKDAYFMLLKETPNGNGVRI